MDISKLFNPAGKRLDISQYAEPGDFVTLRVIPIVERYELYSSTSNGVDLKKAAEILENKGISLKEIALELESNPTRLFEVLTDSEVKQVVKDVDMVQNIQYKIKVLSSGVDNQKHSFTDGKGKLLELTPEFWENMGTYAYSLFEFIYNEVEKYQKEYSLGETTGKISNIPS